MEALSSSLQPYKNTVGTTASIVTIAHFFAGVPICKDIYNKKSTEGISVTPFVGGAVVGILMLKLALFMADETMLQVNIAAVILNTLYTVFYYLYSKDKNNEVLKPLSYGVALVAIFLGYATFEDEKHVLFRYSLLVTLLMLLLIGSPLMNLSEIIEKKDASSIPFPITFMGALVSFLWLLYGIIINNIFMIVQNVVGLTLCIVQLWLMFKYPGNTGQIPHKKKKKVAKRD